MLRLRDFRHKAKGLPDLLPYAALVAPGVVLCKDGSFLAAWEFRGQDTASSTPEELAFVSAQVNSAVKLLGTGWMLHVDAVRCRQRAYSRPDASHFPDPVTRRIDAERRAYFSGDRCYSTRTFLCASFKPNLYAGKLAGAAQAGVAAANVLEKNLGQFQQTLLEIEDALAAVLRMHRLEEYEEEDEDGRPRLYSALLEHLQHCLTGEEHPVRVPTITGTPMYLDALLGGEDLVGGLAPRIGAQHIAVLGLDGLPQESWPAMLATLDGLQLPYRFSTRFICLDQLDATREITTYRKTWQQQVFRFFDQFFNNPNARANRDAQLMTEDAEQALVEVQSGFVGAGYLTSCIVLLHEEREVLLDWARELRRAVQTLGFGCRLETINAVEAWLGTHPGNGFANIRRPLVHTLNLADLLPLAGIWAGYEQCPCPFYPPDSPPLMVCTTDGATPFRFNLHEGDVGHSLVFGPTGSGKSTLLALIAAQFRRYKGAQVFCFDKGQSMLPLCLAVGGAHYDIGAAENTGLALAPLQSIDASEAEQSWAEGWIADLAELQGLAVLPGHRNAIHTAMNALRQNPPQMRSLTDFWHVVQDQELRAALQHYTKAGAMGSLLDAATDTLGLGSQGTPDSRAFVVFEVEALMQLGDKNLVPVLLYLFHRIEKALRGQPALLVLDEAWVMLGHAVFREKIREWLKVLRKANCAVLLATQSLSDAVRSGILDVLVESCPTKILLPNLAARQDGQRELYAGMGLNARQIEIVATATPKRDYYVLAPAGRRLVQLALQKQTLAFVGVSDRESVSRIKELHATHGRDWVAIWLKEKGAL